METCTWAPTVFQGTQLIDKRTSPAVVPDGEDLQIRLPQLIDHYESLGVSNLLIAQRWWGNGEEIEASSLDCLAMTAFFANCAKSMKKGSSLGPAKKLIPELLLMFAEAPYGVISTCPTISELMVLFSPGCDGETGPKK